MPGAEQQVAWTEKKCCSKCGQSKSLMVFKRNDCGGGNIIRGDGRRNRRPDCKVCYDRDMQGKNKAKACAKRLGISYKAPEGTVCRLCSKPGTKSNPLVFDHHHELDVFRGYCCNRCNIGMGALGDNVSSIARVLKYMNESRAIKGAAYGDALQLIKNQKKQEKQIKKKKTKKKQKKFSKRQLYIKVLFLLSRCDTILG